MAACSLGLYNEFLKPPYLRPRYISHEQNWPCHQGFEADKCPSPLDPLTKQRHQLRDHSRENEQSAYDK
jgi:hypothetical protein